MSEPCDLTAVDARRQIADRSISPVELMESCLARIEAVNPTLNAIVTLDAEAAMDAARKAEAGGGKGGLLYGLPTAIKDNRDVAGMRTTHGSLIYEHHVPEADEPGVARLRAAGAAIFAKTNLPEFGAGANTTNRVFGATGNPFDPGKTPAGSSGGSAAALATGMVPIATGSDYGGSLRTPASFCGIVGFRPSLGVVPAPENTILSPWGVNGPMGRTVADTHLLFSAMAGHDARDAWSDDRAVEAFRPADLGELSAALSEDLGAAPVAQAIREVFRERVGALEGVFGTVETDEPDFGAGIHDVFEVTRGIAFLVAHHERLEKHRDLLDRNVVDNCERGLTFSAADVAWAQREQSALYRRVLGFFERHDVVITPAASVSPFPHETLFVEAIDDEAMPTYMRWLALAYMPTLALCCAAVIPCGRDAESMPFGIQIIGPKGSDAKVFSVALALEAVFASDTNTARPVPDLSRLSQ